MVTPALPFSRLPRRQLLPAQPPHRPLPKDLQRGTACSRRKRGPERAALHVEQARDKSDPPPPRVEVGGREGGEKGERGERQTLPLGPWDRPSPLVRPPLPLPQRLPTLMS